MNQQKISSINVLIIILCCVIGAIFICNNNYISAHAKISPDAYDISSQEGNMSSRQTSQLKHEINFMILRGKVGLRTDTSFRNNSIKLQEHNIPYGVYSSDNYRSPQQAKKEAYSLYHVAPEAKFYANYLYDDIHGLNKSTRSWANEIHSVSNKPVILYSSLSFIRKYITQKTLNKYNAIWVKNFNRNPGHLYNLWQYTDRRYSPALRRRVDASVVLNKTKPLSFWTGTVKIQRPRISRRYYHTIVKHGRKENKSYRLARKFKYYNHGSSIDSAYYTSHNVRHLCVVRHGGIHLFNRNGQMIKHLKKGSIIHVCKFKPTRYNHKLVTVTITKYHGKYAWCTAYKDYVWPKYYSKRE